MGEQRLHFGAQRDVTGGRGPHERRSRRTGKLKSLEENGFDPLVAFGVHWLVHIFPHKLMPFARELEAVFDGKWRWRN